LPLAVVVLLTLHEVKGKGEKERRRRKRLYKTNMLSFASIGKVTIIHQML